MTEGIVQRACQKFRQRYFFSPSIIKVINEHEQELIAEIKKEIHRENFNRYCDCEEKLIGDTE